MEKLKYYCAKSFNMIVKPVAIAIPLVTGYNAAAWMNADLDNYTTPQTEQFEASLNKHMKQMEQTYTSIEDSVILIQSERYEVGEQATTQRLIENNARAERLEADIKDFEYNLAFSQLSETSVSQVIEEFNGLRISEIYELPSIYRIDVLNEARKEMKSSLKQPTTAKEKQKNLDKLYREVDTLDSDNDIFSVIFAFAMTGLSFAFIASPLENLVLKNKTLNEWKRNSPANRRKKLKPVNPDRTRKL